jgi:hypothetical protein
MATKKAKPVKKALPKKAPIKRAMIDHTRYECIKFTGSDGQIHYSRDNGDPLAVAMRGLGIKELHGVAKANGLKGMDPKDYIGHAQFRMALGLRLRGVVRRGERDIAAGKRVPSDYWPRINGRVIRTLALTKKAPAKKTAKPATKSPAKKAPARRTTKTAAALATSRAPAPAPAAAPVAQAA